jgi:hypothetical protein
MAQRCAQDEDKRNTMGDNSSNSQTGRMQPSTSTHTPTPENDQAPFQSSTPISFAPEGQRHEHEETPAHVSFVINIRTHITAVC